MGSSAVIDIEQLLAPIAGDNPCGESLRWDPVFDEIKQARREDDRDAFGGNGAVQANWNLVSARCQEALRARSKDLMLAGYLLESLIQIHGFAGLRDGLRLLNGLLENFWDGVYPQMDGEDLEPRAAPFVWLTEPDRGARLPNRAREIAITPSVGDQPGYSWSFWKSRYTPPKGDNEDSDVFARRRNEAEERAKLFETAAATAAVEHFAALRDDIVECQEELGRLQRQLNERFGSAAPGTSALRQTLEECAGLVSRIYKEKGGGEEEAEPVAGTAAVAENGKRAAISGPIATRADALTRLNEVAAFFRQTEPHSPISYLVERASAWGRMSLEELLSEIIKDRSTREQLGELLGLKMAE